MNEEAIKITREEDRFMVVLGVAWIVATALILGCYTSLGFVIVFFAMLGGMFLFMGVMDAGSE